uniref:peptidylprolyl isomerase n=1 Tax=Scleropages formosus TaxID=113540 RepID=A0A8C9SW31_SCLFO
SWPQSCRSFLMAFVNLAAESTATQHADDLKVEVLFSPHECPRKSKKGDLVNAHYDGYLQDGSQFYCSRSDRSGHPQWFVLGVGQVIRGLDEGMKDMCPGERRRITVPPELGFGAQGKDKVPPNATLVFEVEVFSVSRGPRSMEAFKEMDLDADRSLTPSELRRYLKAEYEKGGKRKEESFYDGIIDDVLRKSDRDGDGTISAAEYNVYEHDEL